MNTLAYIKPYEYFKAKYGERGDWSSPRTIVYPLGWNRYMPPMCGKVYPIEPSDIKHTYKIKGWVWSKQDIILLNNLDAYTFNEIAKSAGEKAPNSNEIER